MEAANGTSVDAYLWASFRLGLSLERQIEAFLNNSGSVEKAQHIADALAIVLRAALLLAQDDLPDEEMVNMALSVLSLVRAATDHDAPKAFSPATLSLLILRLRACAGSLITLETDLSRTYRLEILINVARLARDLNEVAEKLAYMLSSLGNRIDGGIP